MGLDLVVALLPTDLLGVLNLPVNEVGVGTYKYITWYIIYYLLYINGGDRPYFNARSKCA